LPFVEAVSRFLAFHRSQKALRRIGAPVPLRSWKGRLARHRAQEGFLTMGRKRLGLAVAVFWTLATAAPAAAQPGALDEVIDAERAFAADTRERGFKAGFLAAVAPDGFIFQPAPTPARPLLERAPDAAPPGPPLFWWPQFAGVANSGDLGFTTGGATIPVRYFTVWQRQADGRWRWIYDGGPPLRSPLAGGADDAVTRLPAATAAAGSAEAALAELRPLEDELARLAAEDNEAARLRFLAEDGLVAGSATASFPGREQQAAELARQPARQRLRQLGGVASRAGDLAFTWGEVRWTRDEQPRWGHYARVWQKRREGWRIVADVLVPAPGAPPAAD
jgi:ketosteroid isomerase-like protein